MKVVKLNILLADDDTDDCLFFEEALIGFQISTHLTTVNDGEQLMQLLADEVNAQNNLPVLPDVLFLDINMPRKNGKECLAEIKLNNKLKYLPVIMFSTSYEKEVVDKLYKHGAHYFIRKPPEFLVFKKVIQQTIALIAQELTKNRSVNISQPKRDDFVLTVQNSLTST